MLLLEIIRCQSFPTFLVQMTIDGKNREEKILFDVEKQRKSEIDRLLKTIRHLENMLKEMENKETLLIVRDNLYYIYI